MKRATKRRAKKPVKPEAPPLPVNPPSFWAAYLQWVNIRANLEKIDMGIGEAEQCDRLHGGQAQATWAMIRHRPGNIKELRAFAKVLAAECEWNDTIGPATDKRLPILASVLSAALDKMHVTQVD